MKNKNLSHAVVVTALAGFIAAWPVRASDASSSGNAGSDRMADGSAKSKDTPKNNSTDDSTLNNKGQGSANNQTSTGGDNAQKPAGANNSDGTPTK